jgi:hypothetical protein
VKGFRDTAGILSDQRPEHFTAFAYLYFFFPAFLGRTVANGPIDKPAKLTRCELPGRTFAFLFRPAFFNLPARFQFAFFAILLND